MSFIQPLTLQRLIDGELDSASMQSLLREADGQPEIWKEIAAAFIEDRAWQNSFVDCSLPADTNSILGSSPAEQVSLKNENANHNKRWRWLFSLAAAVLLATFVGYMIGNQQPAGLHTGAGLANVVTAMTVHYLAPTKSPKSRMNPTTECSWMTNSTARYRCTTPTGQRNLV